MVVKRHLFCMHCMPFIFSFRGVQVGLGTAQAPQAQNTWSMRQLVYIENCMGKSPIEKKLCK